MHAHVHMACTCTRTNIHTAVRRSGRHRRVQHVREPRLAEGSVKFIVSLRLRSLDCHVDARLFKEERALRHLLVDFLYPFLCPALLLEVLLPHLPLHLFLLLFGSALQMARISRDLAQPRGDGRRRSLLLLRTPLLIELPCSQLLFARRVFLGFLLSAGLEELGRLRVRGAFLQPLKIRGIAPPDGRLRREVRPAALRHH
mmetsp:Transcript_32137/g.64094  ORF Transcript_32137/g.64094 Transcript_32137/m.64094 type:complete len:200 (+) Transcript_32137:451-1050(+)